MKAIYAYDQLRRSRIFDLEPGEGGDERLDEGSLSVMVLDVINDPRRKARDVTARTYDRSGKTVETYGQPGSPVPQWITDIIEREVPRP